MLRSSTALRVLDGLLEGDVPPHDLGTVVERLKSMVSVTEGAEVVRADFDVVITGPDNKEAMAYSINALKYQLEDAVSKAIDEVLAKNNLQQYETTVGLRGVSKRP